MATIKEGKGRLKSRMLCDGNINEGDPYVALSWMYTSNPAHGRGWLLCTLPTLPQSQNLCVWALCYFLCCPSMPLSKQGASHVHPVVLRFTAAERP